MSSADEAEKLAQFRSLTGAPEPMARSYLEATNWDIETAAESFFEEIEATHIANTSVPSARRRIAQDGDDVEDEWEQLTPEPPTASTSMPQARRGPTGRVATLGDFGRSNDEEEDEGRQNFFAGGEKSGLSVQNPNQPQKALDEVRSILDRAMNAPEPPTEEPTQQPRFTGTGYTLGSESQPSQPVVNAAGQQRGQRPPTRRALTLWRNGFTIDDGPLYAFSEPETLEILREIRMGRLPRHIANVDNDEEIEMAVEKRENEDWTPAASRSAGGAVGRGTVAGSTFHGQGNRLGSAIPGEPIVPAAPSLAAAAAPVDSNFAQPTPEINPSLPQTTIQLRLADGTRLVTQFNLISTMNDVYSFVSRARPTQGREFVLQTIFPTRVLEKGSKTIEQEGLKSGTVVMRWKA